MNPLTPTVVVKPATPADEPAVEVTLRELLHLVANDTAEVTANCTRRELLSAIADAPRCGEPTQ